MYLGGDVHIRRFTLLLHMKVKIRIGLRVYTDLEQKAVSLNVLIMMDITRDSLSIVHCTQTTSLNSAKQLPSNLFP